MRKEKEQRKKNKRRKKERIAHTRQNPSVSQSCVARVVGHFLIRHIRHALPPVRLPLGGQRRELLGVGTKLPERDLLLGSRRFEQQCAGLGRGFLPLKGYTTALQALGRDVLQVVQDRGI